MQTKKRAKPVKFGKAAREAESKTAEKVEAPVIEPQSPASETAQPEAPKASVHEQPAAPATPAAGHNNELVDKLSDVPFETDFGSPASPSTAETPPTSAAEATPPAPAPEQPSQEEPAKPSEFVQPTTPQIDVTPVQPNAPIGRANEPIPFNPHETVFNTPPEGVEKKKNPFLYFIVIAFVAFVTGIAFMAGIYYAMPDKNLFALPGLPALPGQPAVAQPTPTTAPSATAEVSPTTAPSKALTIADYTVKVQNGSGVSGQAAKVKALLEAEGFKVGAIGNADSNTYAKTEITVKKSVDKSAVTKLTEVLKKTYVLNSKITELPATATAESDITVIIGKETVQ